MSKLIEFIKLCVSNPLFPLSWGTGNISVGDEFISFFVKGSRYQGQVVIEMRAEGMKVTIGASEEIFINAVEAFFWLDQHIE